MTTLSEGKTPGDIILFEEDSFFSRKKVTIASGADLTPGAVLGKITASGKYMLCDHAAVDGSEVAVAVLLEDADAASADVEALILHTHAQVRRGALVWDANFTTETQRDAAVAELAAQGIQAIT